MAFPISAALLDAIVLSIVSREGTYGYKITQDIRKVCDVSESTLYRCCAGCSKPATLRPMTRR